MRTAPMKYDVEGLPDEHLVECDHKDTPDDVAIALNRLLAAKGLEFVMHVDGSDCVWFSLAEIK